jgi:ATP synthase protein I
MEIRESNSALWRGALFPSILVSLTAIVVATMAKGRAGLFGALLASLVVLIFFSVSLLVARLTQSADPVSTFALALLSYFTKLLLIALFLIAVTRLTSVDDVDRLAFGVSAISIAFAWLSGEVRAFLRLRLQLTLPHDHPHE